MFSVTLKEGSEWRVRAANSRDAISRVKQGKGRLVGKYLKTFRKDSAEPLK
jgi:hypothetical protein